MSRVDEFIKRHHEFREISDEQRQLLEEFIDAKTEHINEAEWNLIVNITYASWEEIREYTDDKFKVAMIIDIGRTANYIWHLISDEGCKDKYVLKILIWSMPAFSRYEKTLLCDELDEYDGRPLDDWSCSDVDSRVYCRIYDLLKDEEGFKNALLDDE